ncbi:Aldolase-type TIM barrel [Quillaja saponaria]|uniref:Aldolase-type TIM barrel n=1 Tax=Quillaja saponaria TaxID=32244 RepID=A0AAD7KWK0_QUISA|nr:Aldolase-type TIM barrel [Quillaja saponaria]
MRVRPYRIVVNPLKHSSQFPKNSHQPIKTHPRQMLLDHPRITSEAEEEEIDDMELLMRLLGLSEEKERQWIGFDDEYYNGVNSCHCEGGFYAKIVGVKGPTCEKEVKRLYEWIQHLLYCNGEGRKEPLRLAHLLLGKSCLHF